jgi:mannose-6-phosphate isomerase-like protein (cupin superfamily)
MNRKSIVALGFLSVALLAAPALATLGEGVAGVVQARGTVGEKVKVREADGTEFVTQQITIQPGGNTGWHTHPGAALAIVKSGTLTLTNFREGRQLESARNGSRCFTQTVSAGESFVDPGHGNVHIARNLGTVPVEVWVTYTGVPPAGAFRLDAADPGC